MTGIKGLHDINVPGMSDSPLLEEQKQVSDKGVSTDKVKNN